MIDGLDFSDYEEIHAFEYDVDALCDGKNVYIAGIMQHIEAASGVLCCNREKDGRNLFAKVR